MATIPINLPLCTHRYALIVSYLGYRYNGSQRLVLRNNTGLQDTIQEALEWSLEGFLPLERCRITASSRTDKGVHALMNCYTLPLMDYELSTEKFKRLANERLISKHHDIIVKDVILVPANFHPRKQAISREYTYRLAVMDNCRSHLKSFVSPRDLTHALPVTELYKVMPLPCLDLDKALGAIDLLSGEHDFASYTKQDKGHEQDTIRDLEINITQAEPNIMHQDQKYPFKLYHLNFKSRAFLYNQVRRLVGSIVSYASYKTIDLDHIKFMLDNPSPRNWKSNTYIAEPWGLFLSKINFDKSAFEGAIKTYENKTEEKVDGFNQQDEESDDRARKNDKELVTCA